ncbi:glycosyl transferase GTA-type super family [Candidatus Termititenax aidoneus]|uniref:Glycosyl transferase GTA-type super family n=1 Tax=Termititenax aidoneus TaxID=2218524 RepID=A0A388TEB9_TERA1|nr:glycosyl transferase GTA-type super family [Candidatus Termititenax aidoneus]
MPITLNKNKLCFITCVNNEMLYERCLAFLKLLAVPPEITVEYKAVRKAASMCAGYNKAMLDSDAKYKIYLHQDAYIIYPYFIQRILQLFSKQNVGLLGVVGAQTLPESCVWWQSEHCCGRVIDSAAGFLNDLIYPLRDTQTSSEALVVDGLLMATQYDLPWREDLFKGWHFYDLAQSLEFYKAGYKTVVPLQPCPWVMHDCGIAKLCDYAKYNEVFKQEYQKIISAKSFTIG